MSAELDAYLADLVQLADLPAAREQAVAEAQRAGQDDIDRALANERRDQDAAEKVARSLATAEDRLRRLEARTAPVEASTADRIPRSLTDLPRYLDDVLRDLDATAHAQEWVERARAGLAQAAPAPTPFVPSVPTHETTAATPVPRPVDRAAGPSRSVVIGAAAALVLLVIVLVLVFR